MIALIQVNPPVVLDVFPGNLANVNVPDKWQAYQVPEGYQTPDGKYKVVAVTPFVPPIGQRITGSPTYATDGSTVTQTYSTEAIPVPPPITTIPFKTVLSRFTGSEYVSIKKAIATQVSANNPQFSLWWESIQAAQSVNTADSANIAIVTAAVSAGILTAPRATLIFTP